MGDIFRRNAFNLGLHVVQSPEAVADARDGDTLTFDTTTRRLANETREKSYEPVPLSEKEEEIRRGGGIFAVGRRELRASVERAPRILWPDPETARRMTATEQIVWAHRVDRDAVVRPGMTLRVFADLLPASDGTAPFAIHTFNQITGGNTIFPRQAAVANDHFVFTGKEADEKQTSIGREFAGRHGIGKPYYATPGDGIFHFYFPEQGLVLPGQFIPGADSHSRAYGAYGAVGYGVGSTTLGFGWATGYVYFTLAKQRRVVFRGKLQPWVSGKDIVLELLRRWGAKQSQGMSVEFVDADRQLPIAYRNTIANMMAEGEAQNGIFAQDEITDAWYREKGIRELPYPRVTPGADAVYEIDEEFDSRRRRADDRQALLPRQRVPGGGGGARAAHVRQGAHRLLHQRQLRRPAAGRARPLAQRARREFAKAVRDFAIFPGSGGVGRQIETPDPRLGGESIAEVFRARRRADPRLLVRPLLRTGPRRADAGPARDHVLQPQLAEPDGPGRRGLSRLPGRRRRLRPARLHGPALRAGPRPGAPSASASDRGAKGVRP